MPQRIQQSTAIRVPLQAYLASDHVTPATGKTIAVTISKNGAAYGNPSAGATNAVEIGSGSYYVDLSTTDTGTIGPVIVKGAEGTIDTIISMYDVADTAAIIFDRADGVETGKTLRQALRAMLAAAVGKASGMETATGKYRDTNDTKDRITATIDAYGNRPTVTLDLS